MTAPTPNLSYTWWRTYPSGAGIIGEGPRLDRVFDVSVWPDHRDGTEIVVWVRGPMLRKDGTPSRVQRSVRVDASSLQPPWLVEVIGDAHTRLGADPEGETT